MLQKIVVEVPVAWFENPLDGLKNKSFFSNFLIALATRPIPILLRQVPFGADLAPRNPEQGTLIFSYHSRGNEKNVFRLKEAPITPLFAIDRTGYSGWADIATSNAYQPAIDAISDARATEIIEAYRNVFLAEGVSKYPQPDDDNLQLPKPYVFFPLQVQNDPVAQLTPLHALDVLREAAAQAQARQVYLLVKRHPFCQSMAIERGLEVVCRDNPYVRQVDANVHTLIRHARSVLTINSGVGLEALIHGASVYASGTSEWYAATHPLHRIEDIAQAFSEHQTAMDAGQRKRVAYLISEYWVDPNDKAALDRKIDECIASFDPEYGIPTATADVAEALTPVILDLQGRLDYASRQLQSVTMDLQASQEVLTEQQQNQEQLINEKQQLEEALEKTSESADQLQVIKKQLAEAQRQHDEATRQWQSTRCELDEHIARLQTENAHLQEQLAQRGGFFKFIRSITQHIRRPPQ